MGEADSFCGCDFRTSVARDYFVEVVAAGYLGGGLAWEEGTVEGGMEDCFRSWKRRGICTMGVSMGRGVLMPIWGLLRVDSGVIAGLGVPRTRKMREKNMRMESFMM